MTDTTASHSASKPLDEVKKRLGDLNTKAYYLLVALSFLCFHRSAPGGGISLSLKLALTLTSIAAVLPLQDFAKKLAWLRFAQWFKVSLLFAALICTLLWIWLYLS